MNRWFYSKLGIVKRSNMDYGSWKWQAPTYLMHWKLISTVKLDFAQNSASSSAAECKQKIFAQIALNFYAFILPRKQSLIRLSE